MRCSAHAPVYFHVITHLQVHISIHEDPTKMTVMWMTAHKHCPSVVLYTPGPLNGSLPGPSNGGREDADELEWTSGAFREGSVTLTAQGGRSLGQFQPSPEGVVTTLSVRA